MFKTTLLLALRSADRVDVHGYEMDNIDYSDDTPIVRVQVAGGDYCFWFDGSQEVEIHDGYCEVVPLSDPEGLRGDGADFGGIVDEEELETVGLEFMVKSPLTADGLLL